LLSNLGVDFNDEIKDKYINEKKNKVKKGDEIEEKDEVTTPKKTTTMSSPPSMYTFLKEENIPANFLNGLKIGTIAELILAHENANAGVVNCEQILLKKSTWIEDEGLEDALTNFRVVENLGTSVFAHLKSKDAYHMDFDTKKLPNYNKYFFNKMTIVGVSNTNLTFEEATLKLSFIMAQYGYEPAHGITALMWATSMMMAENVTTQKMFEMTFTTDTVTKTNFEVTTKQSVKIDLALCANLILRKGNGKMSMKKYYVEFIKSGKYKNTSVFGLKDYYGTEAGFWRFQIYDLSMGKDEAIMIAKFHEKFKNDKGWTERRCWNMMKLFNLRTDWKFEDFLYSNNWKDAKKPVFQKAKSLEQAITNLGTKIVKVIDSDTFANTLTEVVHKPFADAIGSQLGTIAATFNLDGNKKSRNRKVKGRGNKTDDI